MNNKLMICNLKMHRDFDEMVSYKNKILENIEQFKNVVICPPVVFMSLFLDENIILGSQDITAYEDLKLTGEIGTCQLKSLNTKYVIIGHSERRNVLKENNQMFINKIRNTLSGGMIPIFCIGELNPKKFEKEINKQIKCVYNSLNKDDIANIIIAYEPIYNVNKDKDVDINIIIEHVKYIRKTVKENFKVDNVRVLYGGNVDKSLVTNTINLPDIDGYLIGRKSLDIKELLQILG
ncbi:MAG: triosephosphate isomerase [Bacilli bacterium]|nr:triosephosphate isomerase [Bacilli bacterium]